MFKIKVRGILVLGNFRVFYFIYLITTNNNINNNTTLGYLISKIRFAFQQNDIYP